MTNFSIFPGQREKVYLLGPMGIVQQTLDYMKGPALCGKMWMILETLGRMSKVLESLALI